MAVEFKFPDVGEGIAEGQIIKWHVKPGDTVKEDQTLLEAETDKAVVEIPSPASGKILEIKFKEGDTVNVGDVICVIGGSKGKVKDVSQKVKDQLGRGGEVFGITWTPGNVLINNETGEYEIISGAYPTVAFESVIDNLLK